LKPRRLDLKAEVHGEAVTLSSLVFSGMVLVVIGRSFPPAVLLLDWLLCLALVGGVQLAVRALRESRGNGQHRARRALIVAAGDAGEMRPSPPWRNSSRRLRGQRWNMLHPPLWGQVWLQAA